MSVRSPGLALVVVVTHPMTARLLLAGQLRHLAESGFRVTLVTSPGRDLDGVAEREGVEVRSLPMSRELNPWRDAISFVRLVRLLRRLQPDVVSAGTPKAGFLAMTAARITGVPVRIYTLRGLRLETATGLKRWLLRRAETLAVSSAHQVLCVSESLRRRAVDMGVVDGSKATVPGVGSSNGVDVDRFEAAAADAERIEELRKELGLPLGAPVIGFVGRLTRDKGVGDLVDAFDRVSESLPEACLLMLGNFEAGDRVPRALSERLHRDPRVVLPGFVPDTAPYYPLMDVLALPSHREGFPNAPLEAAAAGVPTVGSRATGLVDAVVDGETGTLVASRDPEALARALLGYFEDPDLRRRHGEAARDRAWREFRREAVWQAWEGAVRATASALLDSRQADRAGRNVER